MRLACASTMAVRKRFSLGEPALDMYLCMYMAPSGNGQEVSKCLRILLDITLRKPIQLNSIL